MNQHSPSHQPPIHWSSLCICELSWCFRFLSGCQLRHAACTKTWTEYFNRNEARLVMSITQVPIRLSNLLGPKRGFPTLGQVHGSSICKHNQLDQCSCKIWHNEAMRCHAIRAFSKFAGNGPLSRNGKKMKKCPMSHVFPTTPRFAPVRPGHHVGSAPMRQRFLTRPQMANFISNFPIWISVKTGSWKWDGFVFVCTANNQTNHKNARSPGVQLQPAAVCYPYFVMESWIGSMVLA